MKKRKISMNWWNNEADKPIAISMVIIHLLALGVFFPQFFSWSGLAVFFLMYYISGGLGITLCYHRLLTHRSFKTFPLVKYALACFACLAFQGPPITWVGVHRHHHKHSDKEDDPHSPEHGFNWAHILWTMTKTYNEPKWEEFALDLKKDRVMRFLTKFWWLNQALAILILLIIGYLVGGYELAISWFVWDMFRIVCVWHATWFVNSACHTWGYKNFTDTDDNSKNLWWVSLISFGEGNHNNHHAKPSSAAHGMKWHEFDPTYYLILLMEKFGLFWNVKHPEKI